MKMLRLFDSAGYLLSCLFFIVITSAAANATAGVENGMTRADLFNVARFGAVPDDGLDDASAIQKALNLKGDVFIPPGRYDIASPLIVYENTKFHGTGKGVATLVFPVGFDGNSAIQLVPDTSNIDVNIEISDLSIISEAAGIGKLIYMADLGTAANIKIVDCILDNSSSSRGDVISFYTITSNIEVSNNIIYGNPNPTITIKDAAGDQHLISIRIYDTAVDSYRVKIDGNILYGGATGFGFFGVSAGGNPPGGVFFTNNVVKGQKFRGVDYHGAREVVCTGNLFENVEAAASKNNDGGVIWLDVQGGMNASLICSNNIIKNCRGNGIYAEELFGSIISDNTITGLSKRIDDIYSVVWALSGEKHTYKSNGGNGIVLTGGCVSVTISDNNIKFCQGNGIYIGRPLGVQSHYYISGPMITGNTILNNSENGIMLEEAITSVVSITSNNIQGNGAGDETNSFAGIMLRRQNSHSTIGMVMITGNAIGNGLYNNPNNQYYGIYKDFPGGGMLVSNNQIATKGGVWLYNESPTSLGFVSNYLFSGRGINTGSGTGPYLINNNLGWNIGACNTK